MMDMFLLSIYADRQWQAEIKDVVWEHGENLYPAWRCKYCRTQKGGGGTTRLKTFGWARGGGGPLQECATRYAGVLSA